MARRDKLNIWAASGEVTDPDLDIHHPGGTGSPTKYEDGWIVEKEPHQWANFLYKKQSSIMTNTGKQGTHAADDVAPKSLSIGWKNDKQVVYRNGVWEESLGNMTPTEFENLRILWENNLAAHKDVAFAHQLTAAQVGTYTKTEFQNLPTILDAPAHIARRDNPHNETAVQIGTLPTSGGSFTGEVTIPSVALPVSVKITERRIGIPSKHIQLEESDTPVIVRSLYTNYSYEILIDTRTLPIVTMRRNHPYMSPEPSAIWLTSSGGHSTVGAGSLTFDKVSGGEINITPVGMLLEAGNTYLLDDLAYLTTGGTCTYILDGVFTVFTGVSTTTDLKLFAGSGKRIRDIRIWSSVLSEKQIAHLKSVATI